LAKRKLYKNYKITFFEVKNKEYRVDKKLTLNFKFQDIDVGIFG
jgi:hypothetical protein